MNSINALQNGHPKMAEKSYHNYTNVGGLNDLKRAAKDDQASALKPVAEQFEAMFVQQLLQESRKVSFDDGWLDGNQGDFYKDWADKQLSQSLAAKGTLGFADNIVKDLTPHIPGLDKKTAEQASQADGVKQPETTAQALALRGLNRN